MRAATKRKGKVVEVQRRSDRVMTVVMVLEEEVLRIICEYGPQSGRMAAEKEHFNDDLRSEWDLHSVGELVLLGMGDFNGKQIEGYEGVHGENGIGERNVEGKLLEFCDEKELCVENARLVVMDLVKKKVKKVVRKEPFERRKVWKLKENDTRARFEQRVGKLVSADAPDLWKCFREVMIKAFDEVCGKMKGRRDQGDTWWWNKDVKEAIARKKDAHKEMRKSGTEANKARLKNMKNRAKKVVTKAMKEEAAEQEIREQGV
ncbi:uncharacterized protein [Acropora muricata]|uniref:uncharacterized protein n=1 Tax=Acropora muricata TaxID=159855 RepID=UPI0034E5E9D0